MVRMYECGCCVVPRKNECVLVVVRDSNSLRDCGWNSNTGKKENANQNTDVSYSTSTVLYVGYTISLAGSGLDVISDSSRATVHLYVL